MSSSLSTIFFVSWRLPWTARLVAYLVQLSTRMQHSKVCRHSAGQLDTNLR